MGVPFVVEVKRRSRCDGQLDVNVAAQNDGVTGGCTFDGEALRGKVADRVAKLALGSTMPLAVQRSAIGRSDSACRSGSARTILVIDEVDPCGLGRSPWVRIASRSRQPRIVGRRP
jgi:hypothetical protein